MYFHSLVKRINEVPERTIIQKHIEFQHNLERLRVGCDYELILQNVKEKKSRDEEEYYHSVCVVMWSDYTGFSLVEAHDNLLYMCAPRDNKEKIKRTSNRPLTKWQKEIYSDEAMDRKEYHNYIFSDNGGVRAIMALENIPTPDPRPDWRSQNEFRNKR